MKKMIFYYPLILILNSHMKKIIILILFFTFTFSLAGFIYAESYPTTCPIEAQKILEKINGCPTIDCKSYSNICIKCCNSSYEKEAVATSTKSVSTVKKDTFNPSGSNKTIETSKKLTTSTPAEVKKIETKEKHQNGFLNFIKNSADRFFRFIGIKK